MEGGEPALPQPPRDSDEMYAFEVGVQSIFASWTAVHFHFRGARFSVPSSPQPFLHQEMHLN